MEHCRTALRRRRRGRLAAHEPAGEAQRPRPPIAQCSAGRHPRSERGQRSQGRGDHWQREGLLLGRGPDPGRRRARNSARATRPGAQHGAGRRRSVRVVPAHGSHLAQRDTVYRRRQWHGCRRRLPAGAGLRPDPRFRGSVLLGSVCPPRPPSRRRRGLDPAPPGEPGPGQGVRPFRRAAGGQAGRTVGAHQPLPTCRASWSPPPASGPADWRPWRPRVAVPDCPEQRRGGRRPT